MPDNEGDRWVLVTTVHRGLFVGVLDGDDSAKTIALRRCRNVIYFAPPHGFLGVAAGHNLEACKFGAVAPRVVLQDVTSIADCAPGVGDKIMGL